MVGFLLLALLLVGLIVVLVRFERKIAAQKGQGLKRSPQERRSARDAAMNVFRVPH
jgi:hypothetical protein